MSLFDPSPFTDERKVVKPRTKPEELPLLKVRWPWALARHIKKAPIAHLVFNRHNHPKDKTPMFTPECDHKIALNELSIDGAPLSELCRGCYKIAKRRKIAMELRERPK